MKQKMPFSHFGINYSRIYTYKEYVKYQSDSMIYYLQ